MINYLVTGRYSQPVRELLQRIRELRATIRCLTYEELFFQLSGPVGHYIFGDIDRLSRYERETTSNFAEALRRVAPDARVLNDPVAVLDRVPLLAALDRAGINDFAAVRIDAARPSRFPVFIRTEDSHFGPETELLNDEAAFDAALEDLKTRRLPLRGRVAVGYAGKPYADGMFRRYSAYKIGDRIFADELFVSPDWAVKSAVSRHTPEILAEELGFLHANPHQAVLRNAFALGNIDFGRADFSIVDGKVQVYEINTNPVYAIIPKDDGRDQMRAFVRPMIVDAFRALDTPLAQKGRVRFEKPHLRAHSLKWPRGWRLAVSAMRRLGGAARRD